MSWREQPNASYYSTRYAERKRAAERVQDAAAPPRTCNRCPERCAGMSIFCAEHMAAYEAMCRKAKRGETSYEDCLQFCQRTHWPEVK